MPESHFEIECRCGAMARGQRMPHSQTLVCSKCGHRLFVFPSSPFHSAALVDTTPEHAALALAPPVRFWLGPAVAAVGALAVVGVLIAALVSRHRSAAAPESSVTSISESTDLVRHYDAAREAIAEGSYRTAAMHLAAIARFRPQFPRVALPESDLAIARTRRQVELLADLSSESIEEIMRHSIGQSDAEWQAVFRDRYAGRAVILDARVFRDAGGRFHIDYQLDSGGLPGEWDVQKCVLFHRLPLQQPQRVIVGLRLGAVTRIDRSRWIVRPQPDGAVLLTDRALLAGLSIAADNEFLEALRKQSEWDVDR